MKLSLIHILTKSTSGRTHNTSIDSSIDLKSYIASAKKTNQELIENAGTQINAKTSEYMSTGKAFRACLLYTSGDLQEICLEEEEIVILLSNLQDNAIRESEKVLKNTGKAVIHLKLECEAHKLIFADRKSVV